MNAYFSFFDSVLLFVRTSPFEFDAWRTLAASAADPARAVAQGSKRSARASLRAHPHCQKQARVGFARSWVSRAQQLPQHELAQVRITCALRARASHGQLQLSSSRRAHQQLLQRSHVLDQLHSSPAAALADSSSDCRPGLFGLSRREERKETSQREITHVRGAVAFVCRLEPMNSSGCGASVALATAGAKVTDGLRGLGAAAALAAACIGAAALVL